MGYGTTTPAGRGGTVHKVTNLNNSGSGSFRACAESSGPRVCIFEVSGNITLTSGLTINNPYITIAGQTAPSPGITLRGGMVVIRTHDVLMQQIRIRVGSAAGGSDGLQINATKDDAYNIVIDHCSVSWAGDENVATYNNSNNILDNITVSNTIISEGMASLESKGFSQGGNPPTHASLHRNLLAHNNGRNPKTQMTYATIVNNVVYNWGNLPTDVAGQTVTYNTIMGNVYKIGPDSPRGKGPIYARSTTPSGTKLYLEDNHCPFYGEPCLQDDSGIVIVSSPPAWAPNLTVLPSDQVETYVASNVGARPADRDAVDTRVINEMLNGTGFIPGTEADVGGWPNLAENHRVLNVPSNPSGDDDDDGYTNLEEWLHAFAAEVEGGVPAPAPTFADVPFDHWAHDYIEALYQAGYTAGCSTSPLMFCPEAPMTRGESAVFVQRGLHGASFTPTAPTLQVFSDVPLHEWFAKWADALWTDGYTAGCGTDPLIFCPLQGHTRTEGTVFYLRMLNGAGYVPPDPVGVFSDVSLDFWGAKWIEAAYGAGLITACETTPVLRFCSDDPLDRATAAFMMVHAKELSLP
jgi:hypothetical protein